MTYWRTKTWQFWIDTREEPPKKATYHTLLHILKIEYVNSHETKNHVMHIWKLAAKGKTRKEFRVMSWSSSTATLPIQSWRDNMLGVSSTHFLLVKNRHNLPSFLVHIHLLKTGGDTNPNDAQLFSGVAVSAAWICVVELDWHWWNVRGIAGALGRGRGWIGSLLKNTQQPTLIFSWNKWHLKKS